MLDENEVSRDESDDLPMYDPLSDLMQKLDEMESQENASFRVYRQHSGNTSKMAFLFTVPADQYPLEELLSKIRDEYGGGDYRVHLRAPTEAGSNQLVANRVFSIEAPSSKESPDTQKGSELTPVVDRLLTRIEQMEERLSNPAPPPQQADPMEMMGRMFEMMGKMQAAMPQPNNQPYPPPKSLAEQMKELRELQEMAGELGGGGGDQSGFTALIRDGLKPMMDLMTEDAKARKEAREKGIPYQPPRQPNTQPNPQPETQPGNDPMSALQNADEGTKAMLSNVRTLLAAAQNNGDPETYAEIVLDFIPEEKLTELYNFLSLPDCMETVIQYFPEVGNYREWFESLRTSILSMLDADEEPGDTSGHVDGASTTDSAERPDESARTPAGTGGHAQDVADDGENRSTGEGAHADSSPRDADNRGHSE